MLLKHIVLVLVASVLVVLFTTQAALVLHFFSWVYQTILHLLNGIFAPSNIGALVQRVIALMAVPVGVTLVLDGLSYAIRQRRIQDLPRYLWLFWIIMACVAIK